MSEQTWFAAHAWLPDGPATDVVLRARDGRLVEVRPGAAPWRPGSATGGAVPGDAVRLPGMVLPGLADGHGHAFHRALRGRTHAGTGSFWTWRDLAYDVAAALDPDSYLVLARAAYAELVLAGVTCAGEFHYLHHGPGGRPYDDPNAMAEALRQAAVDAGLRLTVLDACYLAGGLGDGGSAGAGAGAGAPGYLPVRGAQLRFADADADAWAERVEALAPSDGMRVGVAAHSVRALPPRALATVAAAAHGRPLHVHVSEQPAEVQACLAVHGCSPVRLLADCGVLGPATTAVHATHVDTDDVALLGGTGTGVCLCPTTERDLADGISPAAALRDAGSPLAVGSDSHAVADLLAEVRGVEMHERLAGGVRGRFSATQLVAAATAHDRLGWHDAGRLAVGARADLVAVRLDTVRTAGCDPAQLPFAATAADVDTVVVDGRTVVAGGHHVLGDVGALLARAVARVLDGAGS